MLFSLSIKYTLACWKYACFCQSLLVHPSEVDEKYFISTRTNMQLHRKRTSRSLCEQSKRRRLKLKNAQNYYLKKKN